MTVGRWGYMRLREGEVRCDGSSSRGGKGEEGSDMMGGGGGGGIRCDRGKVSGMTGRKGSGVTWGRRG